ncbi:MAG: prephenate dehydratase [Firmicutes bacterium]|nr:prephenate dehydratase [Bacillota bacterium]
MMMIKRIGFLGPAGTFSHEATEQYLLTSLSSSNHAGIRLLDYPTIPSLVAAIGDRTLDEAVLPVENSWEGTVNLALDSLAAEVNTWIKAEVIVPVHHHLLAGEPIAVTDIVKVVSHPQALAQCRRFLAQHLPHADWVSANSTAEAAKLVTGKRGWAAIGSKRAAEFHHLLIIASNIQDCDVNETRFVVLAQSDSEFTGNDKTSLLFSAAHRPGSLYEILAEFARRGINLCKIESRPAKRRLGEYVFFVDVEGHRVEPAVAEAIEAIRARTGFLRVLGSYPRFGGSGPSDPID